MNPPETITKPASTAGETLPEPEAKPTGPVFASRDEWLAAAGRLAEEWQDVPGLGRVLCGEIGADVRADITTDQSAVLLTPEKDERGNANVRKLDRRAYERKLLLHGVLDPSSPEGNRLPLLQPGDIDRVFKIGGAKIGVIIETIERLSMLGRYAQSAEGNSNGTQSSAGT
jgi:hypothetical protein